MWLETPPLLTMDSIRLLTVLAVAPMLSATLRPVTCDGERLPDALKMAEWYINRQQDHGYKFGLSDSFETLLETVDDSCTIRLQFDLKEMVCPFISPKPAEECEFRGQASWAVTASCTLLLSVTGADANVTEYGCSMRKDPASSIDMLRICPDCPLLLPLSDEGGIRGILAGVAQFNQNTTNQRLYRLQDVGRISAGYIVTMGMMYYSEFVLVETVCPMGSNNELQTCAALCPDRANHAFCHLSYATKDNQVVSLDCELFPPKNSTQLGPFEEEPTCQSPRFTTDPSSYLVTCPGGEPAADPTVHPICPYPAHPAPPGRLVLPEQS